MFEFQSVYMLDEERACVRRGQKGFLMTKPSRSVADLNRQVAAILREAVSCLEDFARTGDLSALKRALTLYAEAGPLIHDLEPPPKKD